MIFFILIVSFIVFIDASGFALSKHLMTLLYSTDLKEKENNVTEYKNFTGVKCVTLYKNVQSMYRILRNNKS